MPTERERQYYSMGFSDGVAHERGIGSSPTGIRPMFSGDRYEDIASLKRGKKRKLSAWQKFVKANSKKPRFRYKSGKKRGKINLKALGVAYRKKRR